VIKQTAIKAANFIWSVYLLIMLDTLLLGSSLHFITRHPISLHSTSHHLSTLHFCSFKLHPTTLHCTSRPSHLDLPHLNFLPLHFTSHHYTSPHYTTLHYTRLHSQHLSSRRRNITPSSSVGILATGWTVRGIESWYEGEINVICPHRARSPLSLLYNGYRVFPRG